MPAPISWSEEEGQILRTMLEQGHSAAVVGGALGRSRRSCIGYAWRKKLKFKGRKGHPKSKAGERSLKRNTARHQPAVRLVDKITATNSASRTSAKASGSNLERVGSARVEESAALILACSSTGSEQRNSTSLVAGSNPVMSAKSRPLLCATEPVDLSPTFAAGSPPFVPANPLPWIKASGCQWHIEIREFLAPGEHADMIVCNEPRASGKRYCTHHLVYQRYAPMQLALQ